MPQRSNSARYLYGDRNPIARSIVYDVGALAPAGLTQRATYTVPALKKAQVSGACCAISVASTAAPAGLKGVQVFINANAVNGVLVDASHGSDINTVGNVKSVSIGQSFFLGAGDSASIYTSDTGTGGTMKFDSAIHITEYDA